MTTEAQFQADGFTEEFNAFLNQKAWVRKTTVENLPYLHEHVEDGRDVRGTMEAITAITKITQRHLGMGYDIWVLVPDADQIEGPYDLLSGEGQQSYNEAVSYPAKASEVKPARQGPRL